MMKKKLRKGFIYTLFAFIFVSFLLLMVSIEIKRDVNVQTAEKIRSDEMSYFLDGVKQDFSRGVFISGKKAILSDINYIVTAGVFLNSSDESLEESMIYGTLNGTNLTLMRNSTLEGWVGDIQELGSKLGMEVTLDILNTTIKQKDSFNLEVINDINLDVYEPHIKARFNKTFTTAKEIPIVEMEEPFIAINSLNYIKQTIEECGLISCTKCLTSATNATLWVVGRVFKAGPSTELSLVLYPDKKILVSSNLSNFSSGDMNLFKAVISETSDNTGGLTVPYMVNAVNASDFVSDDDLIALSTEADLWIPYLQNEILSVCYIRHNLGPTFLDRLEGNTNISNKYMVENKTIGMATFVDIEKLPLELQKSKSEIDFIYFQDT